MAVSHWSVDRIRQSAHIRHRLLGGVVALLDDTTTTPQRRCDLPYAADRELDDEPASHKTADACSAHRELLPVALIVLLFMTMPRTKDAHVRLALRLTVCERKNPDRERERCTTA